jgi:hypothetical protein
MKKTFVKLLLIFLPVLMLAEVSYVYYSFKEDPWTFNRRNTDGTNPIVIYTPSTYMVYDAGMDPLNKKLYFHEKSGDDSWIYKSSYDGTGKTTIKTSAARFSSMAVGDGYVFYAYQDDPWSVGRCDSTGSNDIQLYVNPSSGSIQKMAYDAENNYLYCYEYNYTSGKNRIFRTDNDGGNFTVVYNDCPSITSITAGAGYFYYQCNADPWNFSRRNSDGTNETLIYTPPTGLVQACAYDALYDMLYFCDYDGVGNRYFYKANPDGSGRTTFFSGLAQNIECMAAPCVDPADVPLPIELASFNAEIMNGGVLLEWETASETENSHFFVLRDDEIIGTVDGNGTSSEPHDYSFIDTRVIPGLRVYQLADVSWNGKIKYHDPVTIDVNLSMDEIDFKLGDAFPNPFNPSTSISYFLSVDSDIELAIYDIHGNKVSTLVSGRTPAGDHHAVWDASDVGSGVYVYSLSAGNHIETKKMILMK